MVNVGKYTWMVCVRDLPEAQKVVKSPFLEVEIRGKFYIQQLVNRKVIVFDQKKQLFSH